MKEIHFLESNKNLSADELNSALSEVIKNYKKLNFLEQYAMFMGKAQILEFCLKGLLARKYAIPFDSMDKWTLGRIKNELNRKGLRKDFIMLLSNIVDYRNLMAHDFLVNNVITISLVNFSNRKLYGDLFRGIYELEKIIIIYNWCEEHNSWG